ncbi:hypothetical protein ABBQ32_005202 [Trebouxia sp. C0010 RCD-2024]
MSAVAAAAKRIVERVPKAARTFKTSTGQQSGGHGHSSGGYDDYIHAEHMYSLSKMPHRKLKMGLACSGIVLAGAGIPIAAIQFQKAKARG